MKNYSYQLSAVGKVHLVNPRSLSYFTTVCGQKIDRDSLDPATNFDGGEHCCRWCFYKAVNK